MLLPALGKAKVTARRISCAGNMKQIGVCFEMYSGDWNGYCPATYSGNGSDPEQGGSWTMFDWQRSLWPYAVGKLSQRQYSPYSLRLLKNTIFFCPVPILTTGGVSVDVAPYYRYGLNCNIFSTKTGITTVNVNSLQPTPYPAAYAQRPSINALLLEVYKQASGDQWTFVGAGGACGNISHSKGCNVLFMDKHVEYRQSPKQIPQVVWMSNVAARSFWYGGI